MNTKLTLIALAAAALSSCSTAYKIAQTPDDVYYSPAPAQNDYVQVNSEEDRNVYNNASAEDREIYRHINNRRWRRLHNYDYDYPYGNSYYPYGYNNYYPVYVDPKTGTSAYKAPRKYNLGAYSNPPANTYTVDPKTGKIITAPITPATISSNGNPVRTFSRPATGTGVGNFIRKVFSPNTNSNTNIDNNTQSRTFEQPRNTSNTSNSSSSSSRSSSSSSGGSAPIRTFSK